jgi:hypothetical protein
MTDDFRPGMAPHRFFTRPSGNRNRPNTAGTSPERAGILRLSIFPRAIAVELWPVWAN